MTTIYVIEKGCYSDYRVEGVFSTRANAERVLALINHDADSEQATIAEWHLDPGLKELKAGLSPFHINMDINGNTEQCYKSDGHKAHGLYVWERTKAPAWLGKSIADAVSGTVWAKDEKHAIKIANEYRAQAIAENRMSSRP